MSNKFDNLQDISNLEATNFQKKDNNENNQDFSAIDDIISINKNELIYDQIVKAGYSLASSIDDIIYDENQKKEEAKKLYSDLIDAGIPNEILNDFPETVDSFLDKKQIEDSYKRKLEAYKVQSRHGFLFNLGSTLPNMIAEAGAVTIATGPFGGISSLAKNVNNIRKVAIGAKPNLLRTAIVDATAGSTAAIAYEYMSDSVRTTYDEDYLGAGLMGAGFAAGLGSIGHGFNYIRKNLNHFDENDIQYNNSKNIQDEKIDIVENEIKDTYASENLYLDRDSLKKYTDAKIKSEFELSNSIEEKIFEYDENLNSLKNELRQLKEFKKTIPDENKVNLINSKIERNNESINNINNKEYSDQALSLIGKNSILNKEKLSKEDFELLKEEIIIKEKQKIIDSLNSKKKDVEKKIKELRIKLEEKTTIKNDLRNKKNIENQINNNKINVSYKNKVVNELIDNELKLNHSDKKLSKKKLKDLKNEIKSRLNIDEINLKSIELAKKDLFDIDSRVKNISDEIEGKIKSKINTDDIDLNIKNIEDEYNIGNKDLLSKIEKKYVNKVIKENIKKEYGKLKSSRIKEQNLEKLNKNNETLNTQLENSKLIDSVDNSINKINKKINSLNSSKEKLTLKNKEILKGRKKLIEESKKIDLFNFKNDTLQKKVPEIYDKVYNDLKEKTDKDLVEFGVNDTFDRKLFLDGFKLKEIDNEVKIISYGNYNIKELVKDPDAYTEVVGINSDDLTPEDVNFIKENGTMKFKKSKDEIYKKDENVKEVTSEYESYINEVEILDTSSIYDSLKFVGDFIKPFFERISNSKNKILAADGRFFSQGITKVNGKISDKDPLFKTETLKRERITELNDIINSIPSIAKKHNVKKFNKDTVNTDAGLFLRGSVDKISNQDKNYISFIEEYASNAKKMHDKLSKSAKESGHEAFANYGETADLNRILNANKIIKDVNLIGKNGFIKVVKNAFEASNEAIKDMTLKNGKKYSDVISKFYVDNFLNHATKTAHEMDLFVNSSKNLDSLVEFIENELKNKNDINLGELADLTEIVNDFKKLKEKNKKVSKHKLTMDEAFVTTVEDINGNKVERSISDYIENNFEVITRKNIENNTGREVLASVGVLSEDFFQKRKNLALKEIDDNLDTSNMNADQIKNYKESISSEYNILEASFLGKSNLRGNDIKAKNISKIYKILSNIATSSYLPMAFLNYFTELFKAFSANPVHASKFVIKDFISKTNRKIFKEEFYVYDEVKGKMVFINSKDEIVNNHFGDFNNANFQLINKTINSTNDAIEDSAGALDSAVYYSDKVSRFATAINSQFEAYNRKVAFNVINNDFIKHIITNKETKLTSKSRLDNLKVNKFNTEELLKYIKEDKNGKYFDFDTLQLENSDLYDSVKAFYNKNLDQIVQRDSDGFKIKMQSSDNPYLRIAGNFLMKFRTFSLQSLNRDLISALQSKDYINLLTQSIGMTIGGALSMNLKIEMKASQRDNPDEYRDKMYNMSNFIPALISQISYASIPMSLTESGLNTFGKTMYNGGSVRSSELSNNFITGNPIYNTAGNLLDIVSVGLKSVNLKDQDITRKEINNITNLIPYSQMFKTTDMYKNFYSSFSKSAEASKLKEEEQKLKNLYNF